MRRLHRILRQHPLHTWVGAAYALETVSPAKRDTLYMRRCVTAHRVRLTGEVYRLPLLNERDSDKVVSLLRNADRAGKVVAPYAHSPTALPASRQGATHFRIATHIAHPFLEIPALQRSTGLILPRGGQPSFQLRRIWEGEIYKSLGLTLPPDLVKLNSLETLAF